MLQIPRPLGLPSIRACPDQAVMFVQLRVPPFCLTYTTTPQVQISEQKTHVGAICDVWAMKVSALLGESSVESSWMFFTASHCFAT